MKIANNNCISIFIAMSLLFSCKNGKQAGEETSADSTLVHITKAQFNQINMQTGTLQKVDFNEEVRARGMADVPPQSKATVSPVVSGSVKSIFVHAGDRVNKGQPLLSFEGPEIIGLQQSYLENSEQLKSLESEYNRQKTLFAEKVSSEKVFLEAESNFKKAVAAGEGLRQELLLLNLDPEKIKQGQISSSAVIYAPIAGDIVSIHADISKFINPTDVVLEIVDTQQLQLYLSVFERDIAQIRQGQKVNFSQPDSPDKLFSATVSSIGRAIDKTDRTALVQAIPSGDARAKLLTGMFIDAGIVIGSKTVWALPVDAVITEENDHFELLLQSSDDNEYVFRKVKVHTGSRNGDYMEIIPDESTTPSSVLLLKGVYNAM